MEKPKTVMLIDDNYATNFIHQKVIKTVKPVEKIIVYEEADEALDFLKTSDGEDKPEIIFLDINMPVMDGWEFLQEYENSVLSSDYSIIIVMLTTSLNPDDEKKANQFKSIKGFENKPLTTEKLNGLFTKYFKTEVQ